MHVRMAVKDKCRMAVKDKCKVGCVKDKCRMAVKDKWKNGLATRQVVPREGLKNSHMRAISEMVASE